MRTTIFALIFLGASTAVADEAVVKVYSLSVQERLETLELIDVSAEKAPNPNAAPLEEDLAQILEEVEALEAQDQ